MKPIYYLFVGQLALLAIGTLGIIISFLYVLITDYTKSLLKKKISCIPQHLFIPTPNGENHFWVQRGRGNWQEVSVEEFINVQHEFGFKTPVGRKWPADGFHIEGVIFCRMTWYDLYEDYWSLKDPLFFKAIKKAKLLKPAPTAVAA